MKRAKLIVASSESSADMLYATQFRAPDPFVYLEIDGRKMLMLSDLEIDRGRREAAVDEVWSYSLLEKQAQGSKEERPSFGRVVATFLERQSVDRVTVPGDFPFGIAEALKKREIKVKTAKGAFLSERLIKTAKELKAMAAAIRITEAGLQRAVDILKEATIRKDGKLAWARKVLTSEIVRTEMDVAVLRAGGEARGDTIVACGEQACDPHERGHGALMANQLIILDIFPRAAKSGYFGDITRTVLKGQASDGQRRLWETCLKGQELALKAIKPGASGREIHEKVKAFFAESGYPTEVKDGRWQGFFHGTGHGLGLEIHEEPRFAQTDFPVGTVITVEPGIYVPGLGGVRHEDDIVVTEDGCRVLTAFPKFLEIPA